MSTDGKQLEALVRQIEEWLLPSGFSVEGNDRVYNDDGVQIAEFDIVIRGRLGSTDILWLIECRDRPGLGPAPGSWIEQLVGRRDRFGFNKVTAVSTTGFADGAIGYAREASIELRTVEEIGAQSISNWLASQSITIFNRHTFLSGMKLIVSENESAERLAALATRLEGMSGNTELLRSTQTGALVSGEIAFQDAVLQKDDLFSDVLPNGPAKTAKLQVVYANDESHFVLDTNAGPIRIEQILFAGNLSIRQIETPIGKITEYRRDQGRGAIAQTANFPIDLQGMRLSLEFHALLDSGEMRIVLRKV